MYVKYVVELTEDERTELEGLVAGGTKLVRKLKRAQALLAANEGYTDEAIASMVRLGTSTVYRTKRRFVEGGLERALNDDPRPGGSRKLTGKEEALLVATKRRFRPIMLTAITTIGGMVPLAFAGANSIGLSYTSFSLTLIGGMTTATLLTLLVVPVFYTLFDDAREYFLESLRSMLGRVSPTSSPAAGRPEPGKY